MIVLSNIIIAFVQSFAIIFPKRDSELILVIRGQSLQSGW